MKGTSKRRRGRLIALALLLLLILSPIVVVGWSWAKTELAVRAFIDDPTTPLEEETVSRLYSYISGDWYYCPPGIGLSAKRKVELMGALIASAAVPEAYYAESHAAALMVSARADEDGSFETMAVAINEALLADRPNVYMVLVGSAVFLGALDPYIDVGFVMTQAKQDESILGCVIVLTMDTLFENKDACFAMLNRPDVRMRFKLVLLRQIRQFPAEVDRWFGGEAEMAEWIAAHGFPADLEPSTRPEDTGQTQGR